MNRLCQPNVIYIYFISLGVDQDIFKLPPSGGDKSFQIQYPFIHYENMLI